jgi:hypothetical protein
MAAMPNYAGTARGNLIPSHPDNRSAERHGLYSRPEVSDEVRELASELADLAPHIASSDSPAVIETARLILLAARVDRALADGKLERGGKLRQLVAERRLLSGQLAQWFQLLGLTSDSRATWAARLGQPSFAERVAEKRREIEAQRNGRE